MKLLKEADSNNFEMIFSILVAELRFLIREIKNSAFKIVLEFLKKSVHTKNSRLHQQDIEKNYLQSDSVRELVTSYWPDGFDSLMIVCQHFDTDIAFRVKKIILDEIKTGDTIDFFEKPEHKQHLISAMVE